MIRWRRIAAAVLVTAMLANGARAVDLSSNTETREREPNPGAALAAVALNIVFLPCGSRSRCSAPSSPASPAS